MRPESEYPETQQLALNMGLIEKVANRGYAVLCSRQSRHFDMDFEDLVAECQIIFLKARDKFDPAQGYQFSTYFYVAAWNRLKQILLKPAPNVIHPDDFAEISHAEHDQMVGILTCEEFVASLGAADRELVEGFLYETEESHDGSRVPLTLNNHLKSIGYSANQASRIRDRIRLAAYKAGMYEL